LDNKALLGLYSILVIPEDSLLRIQLHHASFREFIVDLNRCDDMSFSVNAKRQHEILALRCLDLMVEHLHYDLCDLRAPGARLSRVEGAQIERGFSPLLLLRTQP
jgi:hypothetical protein